ncbi:hypothetical protein KDH_79900 [Dictyobacter sp. S3.2.2.5]|uniref:Enterochelin esterase N-terminal domain-containing protein n=1 Tax=Dictyobacter halimunensis TaxID=3026934 RepID=A0ABQ6G7V3_9CHLR|nr:hypothetical protein KDH_79900 [Dictyobacter sp. S3.2.2.5]
MTTKTSLTSPRLVQLQRDLQTGQAQALDLFWQDIGEQGTPLIEVVPGDEVHRLVTFLWKDPGETHNVVIIRGPTRWGDFAKNQMVRLPETNVWYKTYQVRSDMRTTYQLSLNDSLVPLDEVEDWKARTATFQVDPLNPHRYVFPQDEDTPEVPESVVSILELPHAPAQPWISPRTDVAQGNVEMHHFHSALLNNTRRVWVYTPPGYTGSNEPYGLLLLFDGFAYLRAIPTPTILDNLLHEHRLPPLVAVLLDSLDQETRNRELRCSPLLVDALRQELLPWIHEQYHVTTDPAQTIIGGLSAGGLAAAFVGYSASETFGNVLSQSGAFWWNWMLDDDSEAEWLTKQFVGQKKLPLRFYIEVGLLERATTVDQVVTNRHLRDVLQAKGYEASYAEFNGGHEYLCWRGSLANGLLTLLSKK